MAQLFAVVHLFALHHVQCAEHGDLLHVEGGSQPLVSPTLAARDDGPVLAASGQPISGHQGDHCSSLTERRDLRAGTAAAPCDLPRLMSAEAAAWPVPTYTSRPLYRLAPKISPPLAA